jgi:hypothetical protein
VEHHRAYRAAVTTTPVRTSTTRNEVSRILLPSQQQTPLAVPGTDVRAFDVNSTGRLVAVAADTTVSSRDHRL